MLFLMFLDVEYLASKIASVVLIDYCVWQVLVVIWVKLLVHTFTTPVS